MPKENAKLQSWRFFHYARKYLGRSTLYSIFGTRHARTVDLWCENPQYTNKESAQFDPIKGLRTLLTMLDDTGHCGIVRSCVAYLTDGTSAGCGMSDDDAIEPKQTISEEILADYRAVADMQAAIEEGHHPDEISALKQSALAEIERTYAKYRRDFYERN